MELHFLNRGDYSMGTFLLVLFYCLLAVPIGIILGATVGIVAGTVVNAIRDIWDRD